MVQQLKFQKGKEEVAGQRIAMEQPGGKGQAGNPRREKKVTTRVENITKGKEEREVGPGQAKE